MVEIKAMFTTLAVSLMSMYKEAQAKAAAVVLAKTGRPWNELDPESWYDAILWGEMLDIFAAASPTKERALVTVGKQVYPYIKKKMGFPPHVKSPVEHIKFEAEGFLQAHRGPELKPRKFLRTEEGNVLVEATAPGYNARLYEGVFLGLLELAGVKAGKVLQTKSVRKGDPVDEFHITW